MFIIGSQLSLAKKHRLPLFLHSRAAHSDFVAILREEGFGIDGGAAVGGRGGVAHSFTGTLEEVRELVSRENLPTMIEADSASGRDGILYLCKRVLAEDRGEPGGSESHSSKQADAGNGYDVVRMSPVKHIAH